MDRKDIKAEARSKLALNMHQAVVLYLVEYAVFSILLVMIALSIVSIGAIDNLIVSIIFIAYGSILVILAFIGMGVLNHAMIDFYIASYKCIPYNVRRLGDTLARNGLTKIFKLNAKRVLLGFLLLLCLIVPGVIYLMRTTMAGKLLVANPKMTASSALSASSKVMSGKVGSYFGLMMSMIGWWILGLLTFGLGYIFILPYINMCKTVYYKRNLQGDKTEYRPIVQPVSTFGQQMPPQMEQQIPPQMAQQVPPQMAQQYMQQQQGGQPPYQQFAGGTPDSAGQASVQGAASVPPIEALGEDDISDLQAAMRDFGGGQSAPEVSEVPIAPMSKAKTPGKSDKTSASVRTIEDSDLVETVKQLTPEEIAESDVMGKKIDKMFSGSGGAESAPKRDYFSDMQRQSAPNDFMTRESDSFAADDFQSEVPIDGPAVTAIPSDSEASGESVMSDDEFAQFIKDFDMPKSEGAEFKPLTRTQRPEEKQQPQQPQQPQQQARPTGIARDRSRITPTGESRLERIRREREERRTRDNK